MSGSKHLSRRKHSGQPLTGLGSAFPQNQALAGARDPAEAARRAGMSEEERAELLEREAEAEAKRDELSSKLYEAWSEGEWKGPPGAADPSEVQLALQKASIPQLQQWHDRWEEDAQENAAKILDEARAPLSLGPESHLYDPLMDLARRRSVEEGLQEISLGDMLFKGYADQTVEVRPGLEVTYRTLTTAQGLWIEALLSKHERTSQAHIQHTLAIMQCAVSLVSWSFGKDTELLEPSLEAFVKPEQRKDFEDALQQRMERLGQLPALLTDDLVVHHVWFCGRVRKLLSGDLSRKVGNS